MNHDPEPMGAPPAASGYVNDKPADGPTCSFCGAVLTEGVCKSCGAQSAMDAQDFPMNSALANGLSVGAPPAGTPLPSLENWLLEQYPGCDLDHLEIPARIVVRIAESYKDAHVTETPARTQGNLWLAYHALKQSEWAYVHNSETGMGETGHQCAYCGNSRSAGHDKDCMIGHTLKRMAESVAEAKAAGTAPTPPKLRTIYKRLEKDFLRLENRYGDTFPEWVAMRESLMCLAEILAEARASARPEGRGKMSPLPPGSEGLP